MHYKNAFHAFYVVAKVHECVNITYFMIYFSYGVILKRSSNFIYLFKLTSNLFTSNNVFNYSPILHRMMD